MKNAIKIQYLSETESDFPLPEYETTGSSGLDIRAFLPKLNRKEGITLTSGERLLISSGFKIEIPEGYEGQIRARSGLALRHGISLANGVGTIDSDYRGPLSVILINFGSFPFIIKHGQRIAQLVITSCERMRLEIVSDLSKSRRSDSGFSSTGNF